MPKKKKKIKKREGVMEIIRTLLLNKRGRSETKIGQRRRRRIRSLTSRIQ
jgi:hypothetical protein